MGSPALLVGSVYSETRYADAEATRSGSKPSDTDMQHPVRARKLNKVSHLSSTQRAGYRSNEGHGGHEVMKVMEGKAQSPGGEAEGRGRHTQGQPG